VPPILGGRDRAPIGDLRRGTSGIYDNPPGQIFKVGLIGKRRGNTSGKVFFSTLFGTGLVAFAMIPLVGLVLYPLGKLAERLGLINRSAIPTEVTSALVIAAMLAMWLTVAVAIGYMLLFVTIEKPGQKVSRPPTPEHRV
jgi:hypothetical protein